jgi:hypothetical protein
MIIGQVHKSSPITMISLNNTNRKLVSFGQVHASEASEHHHFTEEQMATMWHSRDELKTIRQQLRNTIRKPTTMNYATDCWRGLEALICRSKESRRSLYITPVLKLLKATDMCDEEVREFAVNRSRKNIEESVMLASKDFMEAYAIYRETLCNKTVGDCYGSIETTRPAAGVRTPIPIARTA